MDVLQVIITFLMIAALLVAIKKKFNLVTTLLCLGLIALALMTIITGTSVIGEDTSGSKFIDLFEEIAQASTTTLAGTGIIIMSVMGYVAYMNHIKASTLFAMLAAKPLGKLKSPYILGFATIVIGYLLKIAIPSGVSEVSLLIATVYPILLAVGLSKATAASVLVLSITAGWGPANNISYNVFELGGITQDQMTVPVFFATKEIPVMLCLMVVVGVAFVITAKIFDKKEGVAGEAMVDSEHTINPKELGIPYFYALLPLIPLVLVLVFSQLVVGSIIISVTAANYLAFFIAFIINLIVNKDKIKVFNETKVFFDSMGTAFANAVTICIAGVVFSAGINAIGGMSVLLDWFASMGGSTLLITIVGSLLAFIVVAVTGSINGTMPIIAPLFANLASGEQLLVMYRTLMMTGTLGSGITPVSAVMIVVSQTCETEIPQIIKRTMIPVLAGVVTVLIASSLIP